MAIKADTYYYNGVDLSTLCESDSAYTLYTPPYVNNMSYPGFPSKGTAIGRVSTGIYQDGSEILLPEVGTFPTASSIKLYSGYASTIAIRRTDSELTIGSTTKSASAFKNGKVPKVLMLVVTGAGGAGSGSSSLYAGGGGGGSGAAAVVIISIDSYYQVNVNLASGATSTITNGGYTNSASVSTIKYTYSATGGEYTLQSINGGGGGGTVSGGGGGGAAGSDPGLTGAQIGSGSIAGRAGGDGGDSGSKSTGKRGGNYARASVSLYGGSRTLTRTGYGGSGNTDYGSGGGGGSSFATGSGGSGSNRSTNVTSSAGYGAGGGGGGCRNGIFGANSSGGNGGNAYLEVYGGYSS